MKPDQKSESPVATGLNANQKHLPNDANFATDPVSGKAVCLKNLKQHPLSAAWPAMQADEFRSLKDSIEIVGIQNPITLFDGMVLDGWHRLKAALEVDMLCPSKLLGDVDPVDFVKAQNDARRNVTASQRALAISAIYSWKPSGQPKNPAPGAALSKTTAELAEMAGTSERTIRQAKVVEAKATPEVKAAVRAGTMSVKSAAETTKPAPESPKPKLTVVAAPVPPEDEQEDAVAILSEENDRLNDRLATVAMDATDEERAAALKTITDLRAENKLLRINLKAVTQSRDGLMNELAQVKRQCISLAAKLKKAG